jgi:acyl-CoA synthetase (AMP-forming)/AMP-acid ligase II
VAVVDGTDILPFGAEGEIWVGGGAVTAGYLGADRDTTVKYCPAPHGVNGELQQGSWYRTGDRGVMDADGLLHFRGRVDRQVKIGGHRIEPAEVELAARRLGCLHACVIPVRRDGKITGLAMAAVLPVDETTISPKDLRRLIAGVLPSQLVPWPIVLLPSLPLDANGKIDRNSVENLISGGVQK